jgi:2-oxoglutarate dehydrogenase E1 component
MSSRSAPPLSAANAEYLEALYEVFVDDPASVPPDWRETFKVLGNPGSDPDHGQIRERLAQQALGKGAAATATQRGDNANDLHQRKQVAVLQLINAYRFRGHRRAVLDPLNQYERPEIPELDPSFHGLEPDDLAHRFNTGSLAGPGSMTLQEILDTLQRTYCSTMGIEYMHINETAEKRWLQSRLEASSPESALSDAERMAIMERVVAASSMENYLHTRYVGQKRFSLEGGESLIALLDDLIQSASAAGMEEIAIGMAHRGRLNVLVNILGKHPQELFDEFEGKANDQATGSGDVKYHLGYSSDLQTPTGPVHLTLAFNPSHLEIIGPVVEGSVRARQDRRQDSLRGKVLPVSIHGDAAFAGQGVVMETFNLAQTRGYSTGGTFHIIINNQIGFTTSDPLDARSTLYCTDVAKMVQAPIFHVNADDPEAVVFLTRLALEYRMAFNKDVVIDLICFRRHGHSEADEPAATQPVMYQRIRQHPGTPKLYSDRLVQRGLLAANGLTELEQGYINALEQNQVVSRPLATDYLNPFRIDFTPYRDGTWRTPCDTSLPLDQVRRLTEAFTATPENFALHKAVEKILAARREMGSGTAALDWGFAETLAYASLVDTGVPVRLSGQDSARGTFFHRHAVFHHQKTGETYLPLQNIGSHQSRFLVINSTLSEEAVLAFEYGYATAAPETLVIWEAQFGDFANGAQVVIDQFITSCEAKWGRHCGLVLLLPHGYDGQGPEHSSARLERFLQLCAEENVQVCVPSTPAQMFHMLRRQVLRQFRRPLVVMSPKSLLRHKLSTSSLEEITQGSFRNVIDEIDPIDPARVERLLVCSGKVYFDLLEARRLHDVQHIAIARIEQLYPFPRDEVLQVINRYPNAREVVWVQEEPRNQGAWVYLLARLHLFGCLHEPQQLVLVARPYSASPAVGYMWKHLEQQRALVADALQLQTNVQDGQRRTA